jgi:phospholipid/cholesterol/gamma-HCH transport system substrate-binding protein
MNKGAPSTFKIASMALFALSCVGLLLFLWLSFGGTIPLEAQGYRVQVAFPNADQLATQADVRVAGVSIGRVVSLKLDPKGNRTVATLQLDNQFVPLHKDARAILRLKTILGETYVEIAPGPQSAPAIPDGGTLSRSNVVKSVQLDDIFNALDPTTRRDFQIWQQQLANAVRGNDQNLNNVLGNLPGFAADANDILNVLDIQHAAVVRLLQGGGTVFDALDRNQAALRNLITTGETTFATTAAQNRALADTFRTFPSFLDQTKATMTRLKAFSLNTDPLVRALEPVAADLGPTLHAVKVLSPNLQSLFVNLNPLIDASRTGLPAISRVLRGATPVLASLGSFLEQLNPVLTWLSLHQQLIADFISNGGAALSSTVPTFSGNGTGHALPQFVMFGTEILGFANNRDPNNRGNTYRPPFFGGPDSLNHNSVGPPAFDCDNTGAGGDGSVPSSGTTPACWVAPALGNLIGQSGKFPHILAAKYPAK